MAQAELKVAASLDDRGFAGGLERMKNSAGSFGSALGGLKGMIAGAFTVGAVVNFSRSLLDMADDMATAAQTFGLSIESVLGMQSAMAGTAIGAEDMMRVFGRLKDSQSEVANKNKTMVDAVVALNINLKEFASLPIDKLLEKIANQFEASGRSTKAFGAISDIFGQRIGPAMIEVLDRINAEGLDAYIAKSSEAAEATRKFAAASDKLEETMIRVKQSAMTWAVGIVGAIENAAAVLGRMSAGEGFNEAVWNVALDDLEADAAAKKPVAATTPDSGFKMANYMKATEKYWKLAEEAMLKEMSLKEQTAYYEQQLSGLRAQASKTALDDDEEYYKLQVNILEIKKKLASVEEQESKARQARVEEEIELSRDQLKLMREAGEKQAAIAEGVGIAIPEMARVNSMQRIGGIVGGVEGAGNQAARIAERTLAIAEATQALERDMYRKLSDIEARLTELGEG
jgi:hypothetical protein